jgi:hypothetical protein
MSLPCDSTPIATLRRGTAVAFVAMQIGEGNRHAGLAEQILRWSGLPVVYLRPTAFLDGLLLPHTAKGIPEEQLLARAAIPDSAEPEMVGSLEKLLEKVQDLAPGDMVIAWQPLASGLESKNTFTRHGEYRCWLSLYCHKRWQRGALRTLKEQFQQLFASEWAYCRWNNRNGSPPTTLDHDSVQNDLELGDLGVLELAKRRSGSVPFVRADVRVRRGAAARVGNRGVEA